MLKQRIITAVLLAPILLAIVIYGDSFWFAILIGVIQAAATYEWLKMNQLNDGLAVINGLMITVLSWMLANHYYSHIAQWSWVFVIIWVLAILWLINHKWGYANSTAQLLLKSLLGVVGIMLFAIAAHALFTNGSGRWLTLAVIVLIWVADIGAYVSGKTMGKHKLAVNISPGKTWEGVLGAMALVAVYAWLVSDWLNLEVKQALMVMVPVAAFSVVGDLTASLAKRQAQIKDSSNLLPGHGGFIDRFDSLIAALPLFVVMLSLV